MKLIAQIYASVLLFQVAALYKLALMGMPLYGLEIAFFVVLLIIVAYQKNRLQSKSFDVVLGLGIIFLLGGAIISTMLAPHNYTQYGQLKSWFIIPIIYFLVGAIFYPIKERKWLFMSWFLGTFFISTAAVYGYLKHYLTYDHRLAFPYTSPNFLAFLVVSGILIGIFLYKNVPLYTRWIIVGIIACNFFVVYQTHSYSNWLALFIAVGVVIGGYWYQNKKNIPKKYVFLGIIFCSILLMALYSIETKQAKWANIFTRNRSSIDSRVMIWQAAVSIGKEHPLNGIGIGNFQTQYLAKQDEFPPYLEWAVPQPHNFWLAVWLQTGLLGFVGMILIFMRLAFLLVKKFRDIRKGEKQEGLLIVALWVAFCVYGIIDTPYFRNDLAFLFWVQVLVTYLYSMSSEKED